MINQLFTLENVMEPAGKLGTPWEFSFPYDSISLTIRKDKNARQSWLKNRDTKHLFYSGFLGHNELTRVNKENPPNKIVAMAADYDCVLTDERLKEVIAEMPVKPAFIETSLGNHRRLVWTLEAPVYVASKEFAMLFMQRAKKWLRLDLLPMLDEPAWEDPARLLCCGDKWAPTGHGPIPPDAMQHFFFECGKAFSFNSSDDVNIGLDIVEAELRKQYPSFNWPGDFTLGSQGPSFWVKDSISPSSALVKPDGMFTWAGHADKPFYTWSDLLGKEFVQDFKQTSIAKATADIWFDGLRYHRKGLEGWYRSMTKDGLQTFLQNYAGVSNKPDQTGRSPLLQCVGHIEQFQSVAGAAPHIPLAPGVITFQGKRCLNTYNCKPIEPVVGTAHWGPGGEFPFTSFFYDTLFFPRLQKDFYLAWFKYFYQGVLERICRPGCMVILMGPPGCGKSLSNRHYVGVSVGGFVDASAFLIGGSQFNAESFDVPMMCLDDDSPTATQFGSGQTHMTIKKLLANDMVTYHRKYEMPSSIKYGGRIGGTANLDAASARLIGPADDSVRDRISFFRCSTMYLDPDLRTPHPEKGGFVFPERGDMERRMDAERPYFLRWLVDWKVPDHVPEDKERWGYRVYHEPSLIELADQTSPAAPFKEVIFSTLGDYFRMNGEAAFWRGTSNDLLQLISQDPRNFAASRSLAPEKVNRMMEILSKENALNCHYETDPLTKLRMWVFRRP